jgi:hypothetical protein
MLRARRCEPAESLTAQDRTLSVELAIADLDDDVTEADAERGAKPARQGTRTVLPTS